MTEADSPLINACRYRGVSRVIVVGELAADFQGNSKTQKEEPINMTRDELKDCVIEAARRLGDAMDDCQDCDTEFKALWGALDALDTALDNNTDEITADGLQKRPAYFTYNRECRAYYFAPIDRHPPPYLTHRLVSAILDIANDGTLAGVELIIGELPPPPRSSRGETEV